MRLQLPSSRPPQRLVVSVLATLLCVVISIGRASGPAAAGITDYSSTLYLSGAASSVVSGAYQLVNSPGQSTTARPAPTVAAIGSGSCTLCGGNLALGASSFSYAYRYTLVDATGGETSPSMSANAPAVRQGQVTVTGLPTTGTFRLYRDVITGSANGPWKLVAQVSNDASGTYLDNIADASLGALLPQSQTRTATFNGTGYYEWIPGNSNPTSATSGNFPTPQPASPAFDGKGWVVDAAGGVSFAAGTWAITVKITSSGSAASVAGLDIGMWKVDNSGAVICTLVDPTGSASASCYPPATSVSGVNPSGANISTAAGTTNPITSNLSLPAFSLDPNQHLYVQFWRHQTTNSTGTTLSTLAAYDGTAQITHPAANGYPNVPALTAMAARFRTSPTLSATFSDPDAGDTGTLAFQLCSDAPCSTVLESGSSVAGLANGANGTWAPSYSLVDGTAYYWRAEATDSAGNVSGWSSTQSFTFDTTPPGTPTLDSPAAAARVNTTQLGATFVDSDATDSGTVDFELCSNASCSAVIASGTSAAVSGGSAVSWTPSGVADGTYYWRLRATDIAGNQTAWTTPTRSFVLDTNPPGVPTVSGPADASYLGAVPTLKGTFTSSDTGDSGTIDFRFCSDSSCTTPVAPSGSSSSGLLNNAIGSWTPTLGDGTYYWQASAVDAAGNQSAWSGSRSFTLDTTAPTTPPLGAVAARAQTTPQLSATFADPPATDNGTLAFQLCPNAGCTSVLQSHTASAVPNNTSVNWTPAGLTDGLYYFRVRATDTALNQSAWATGSFTVDTVAPAKPALVSPPNAGRANVPQLSATFTNSDPTDSGTVTFQLCSDAACATVLGSGTSATVGSGAGVSWTGGPLADGTYYWRASSLDVAGNQGAWSSVRSFVLDTTSPAVPTLGSVPSLIKSVPSLSGSFSDPDAPDTGSVSFQICSDSACTSVVLSGSSPAGIVNGGSGSWTATGLTQGSYFWRARAQDAAGNQSAWSASQQFTLDTTPPPAPTQGAFTDGKRLNQPPTLTAVYNDPSGGTGSLTFEICSTSSCASPVLTYSGTTGSLAAGATGSWTPAFLFDGPYYWRVGSADAAGNASGWSPVLSFTVDATPPAAPVPVTPSGLRVQGGPMLSARVDDPTDPGDQARLLIEICSDADCASTVTVGYSAGVPVGTTASWQAPALGEGTYYWRALAEDIVGNQGDWSATRTFVVDNTAPSVPVQTGLSDGAVVNRVLLSGTFSSSDPGDSGTLQFQVCADPDCTSIVLAGSSASVASGGTASWMADTALLDDGAYFWRVRSVDAAGNASDWSATRSFTLDQTPPGRPKAFKAKIDGQLLMLSWRPPADVKNVHAYALIVNGRKTRTLTPKTLHLRIRLRLHDRRSFAIATIDAVGNMSATTRTIATYGGRVAVKQARSSAAKRHR